MVDGVSWSLRTGLPGLPPLKKPRATPTPSPDPSAVPTPTPAPTATPDTTAGARSIAVQWRDVAGNWSAPIEVPVWYAAGHPPHANSVAVVVTVPLARRVGRARLPETLRRAVNGSPP